MTMVKQDRNSFHKPVSFTGYTRAGNARSEMNEAPKPLTVTSVVDELLVEMSADDKNQLRQLEHDELHTCHFGLALDIRNRYIHGQGGELIADFQRLMGWAGEVNSLDYDTASNYVVECLWNRLRGQKQGACMTDNDSERVTLTGGSEHTAHWLYFDDNGGLVVEFYDFSDAAHDLMGNDVAMLLHIDAEETDRMLSLLLQGTPEDADQSDDKHDLLLKVMSNKFTNYWEVEKWLEASGITFRKEFDSWA